MVVDRLEDRTAHGQQLKMLLHHVDVVALRVKHGERDAAAFIPVVAVVVVHADRGGPVGAKRGAQIRQARLDVGLGNGKARDVLDTCVTI